MQDASADIEVLRQKIDELDGKIVRLLNQRAALADQIGRIKRRLQIAVYAPGREEQVVANVQALNPGPLSTEAIARLYERIIDESRRLEQENINKHVKETDAR